MIALREMMCATGLEEPARAALRYAFSVAEQFHCPLQVVHVCETSETRRPETYLSGSERMAQAIVAHGLRERLDLVVRALPTGATGRATTHLVDGKLPDALLAFAERQRAGLLVLGSRASTGSSAHSGSIAERVMHRTSCGVLTVPSREPAPAPRVKRILLVLEPGRSNGLMLDWAVLLAGRFGALLQLIYCEHPWSGAAEAVTRLRHEVEETLRRAHVRLDASSTEQAADLTARVLSKAESGSCDLIAMSTGLKDDTGRCVLGDVRRTGALPVFSLRDVSPEPLFLDSASRRRLSGESHAQANEARRAKASA